MENFLFRLSLKIESWFLRFRQFTGWFKGKLRYAVVDNYEEADRLFNHREVDVVVVQLKDGKGDLLIGRAQYTAAYQLIAGSMPLNFSTGNYTCHRFTKFCYALENLLLFTRHYNLVPAEH